MSSIPSFKKYLSEYNQYSTSFSEVISDDDADDEDDGVVTKKDVSDDKNKQTDCKKVDKVNGKRVFSPSKFRSWMQAVLAAN